MILAPKGRHWMLPHANNGYHGRCGALVSLNGESTDLFASIGVAEQAGGRRGPLAAAATPAWTEPRS